MRSFFGGALGAFAVLGITIMACSSSDGASPGDGTDAGGTANPDGNPGTTPPDGGAIDTSNPDGGVSSTYVPFDINHVLVTGQSNETGNDARPPLSTTQSYGNLMFDTGPMSMQGGFKNINRHNQGTITACDDNGCTAFQTPASLKPLVEGDNYFGPDLNGDAYTVETPASGIANEIGKVATTQFGLASHAVLASVHGRSGNAYACLRKGGGCESLPNYGNGYAGYHNSFTQGMEEVTAGSTLAKAANKSYVVRGVVVVHGEQDSDNYFAAAEDEGSIDFPLNGTDGAANSITSYADALLEWQRDYESSAKAITAQTQPIPLFVSQLSNWGGFKYGRPASVLAQMQLDAHIKAPGKVIVVGPSYPLPFDQGDCLHFTNVGERRLGEYFGKVYAAVVIGGRVWEPVRPKTISRNGTTITVQFYVPKAPLVFDTTQVTEATNKGFTFVDANGNDAGTITNVALTAADTVTITFASAPLAGMHLRYAMNHEDGACVGPNFGARGNLRDSDDTPSESGGAALQNWGVHFDVVVP